MTLTLDKNSSLEERQKKILEFIQLQDLEKRKDSRSYFW